MAEILNNTELKKLIGTVIIDGDETCIRPNSYVLRLGKAGEFLNTEKEFELGKKKKGVKIPPGHAVALTAYETLDFRRETVHKHYPDQDLHGILSPTTDLSREGIVAPSTQVDAGYYGTLNWTLSNTSNSVRSFVHKERIFRIMIFKLAKGETPEELYDGDYQSKTGYVRSQRLGAPSGMKDSEWETAHKEGGPEDLLDDLIKSGYPWHTLGKRLKMIDQQLLDVTEEYANIHDAISKIERSVTNIKERQSVVSDTVRDVLREEAGSLQNRWLIGAGTLMVGVLGIVLSIVTNTAVSTFLNDNGPLIGIALIVVAAGTLIGITRQSKKNH